MSVGRKIEYGTPVDSVFEDVLVGAAQEVCRHGIDDGAAFGVVVRVRDFFEELLSDLDELWVGPIEVAKDGEGTSQIVHRWGATKRRGSLERYGYAASNDVICMLVVGELELIFERASQLDGETLVGALGAQQITLGLTVGEYIAGPICVPDPIAAWRRRIVLRCDRLGWNILRLTHRTTLVP